MAMDNAIALGIQPLKIDVATPLMQAAKIRQEQVQTQQHEQALQQDAAGQFARGVAVYADKPEFAQKWAEGLDDLHARGLMPTQAYQSLRGNPSPLVLQSILASTQKPELALETQKFGELKRHAGVLESQGQQKIDLETLKPEKIGESLAGDIFGVRDPKAPGGYRIIDPKSMGTGATPQPGGPQPATTPGAPSAAAPAWAPSPAAAVPGAPLVPGAATAAPISEPAKARQAAGQKYLDEQFPGDKQSHGLIERIADYDVNPATLPMKKRDRYLAAASGLAAARGETYDQANYATRSATMTAFAKGKQGDAVRSFNVGIEHLDQLGELGKALNNGNIQGANKVWNWAKTQIGYDGPTNFEGLKAIVGAEIVKAIVGAGGGVEERKAAGEKISGASSPAQLEGIINTYKGAMGAQLGGLERQYETGTLRKDFRHKLSPAAVRMIEAHEKGGAAGTPAGGDPAAPRKTSTGITYTIEP